MSRIRQLGTLAICLLTASFAHADEPAAKLTKDKLTDLTGKQVVVVTTSGRVFSGLLNKVDNESILVKQTKGGEQTIARKDIEVIMKAKQRTVAAAPAASGIVVRRAREANNISGIRQRIDPQDPQERLLLLTPGGPLVIEAKILLNGKPFRMAREALVEQLLQAADTNGDGKSTWQEGAANPRFGFGRFVYYTRNKTRLEATIKRYDFNKNGLIETAEAHYLIASLEGGGATFSVTQSSASANRTDLKRILDSDGDGLLAQLELSAAPEQLKRHDANDNDLLEAAEAGGRTTTARYRNVQVAGRGMTSQPSTIAFLLGPTANLVTIYNALQKRYAGDDDQIEAKDFRWLPDLVTTLDLDKNGRLDSGELVGLHLVRPHLKLEVGLGSGTGQTLGIRLVHIDTMLGNQDRISDKLAPQIVIERPGMKLTLAAPKMPNPYSASYTRSAQAMLSRYDTDKNNYIDNEEIKKQATGKRRYLIDQFRRWDTNGDGMVYANEIKQAYTQQLAPRMTAVAAVSTESGPSFFFALDENGNNRISLREMKRAPERLASFDKNGDGNIGVDEMPVELALTFTRGITSVNRYRGRTLAGRTPRPNISTKSPKTPDWFTRMDRNGDGDITLREFLGNDEKFKQLDSNNDGFIDRAEAAAVASR